MNIGITVTVGSVMIEANAQDCGPDACADMMAQATKTLLTIVDREACMSAARHTWDGTDVDADEDDD